MSKVSIHDSSSSNKKRSLDDIQKENDIFLDALKNNYDKIKTKNEVLIVASEIKQGSDKLLVDKDLRTLTLPIIVQDKELDKQLADELKPALIDKRRRINNG